MRKPTYQHKTKLKKAENLLRDGVYLHSLKKTSLKHNQEILSSGTSRKYKVKKLTVTVIIFYGEKKALAQYSKMLLKNTFYVITSSKLDIV